MAYDPQTGQWKYEDDSVSTKLTGLLKTDSPYLKQAQTDAKKIANRRGLLNSSLAATAGTDAAIRSALPVASQDAQQTYAKNISAQDFTQTRGLQDVDVASKEKIAGMNVAAHDRQFVAAAVADLQKTYGGVFSEIQKNENLTAEARDRYLDHAAALRDSDLNLVEQIYGIDLDWATAAPVA